VPRLSLLQPDLSARLRDILQLRVPRLPPLLPNWEPGQWLDEPARIALEEGIPMAYVPSSELVAQLVTLDSREDRLALIEAQWLAVTQHCAEVLHRDIHGSFASILPLADAAAKALLDGHPEAAQALSVVVCDTLIKDWFLGTYASVKNEVRRQDPGKEPDDATFDVFRYRLVIPILPLHEFLEEWSPRSPRPRPAQLCRHVSIHHADVSHYSRCNAVLALMLVTGMIASLSEALFRRDARRSGQDGPE
jgi:hypothetical protein